ncbi:MAG: hypothetical protein ABSF62_20505 [Bryobacteraceae bacterium]
MDKRLYINYSLGWRRVHDMKVESPVCLWGQAFSLPPGFCPASSGHPKSAG